MSDSVNKREFLTTTEAAKILSVSPDTVLKWVKAGKIRSYRTFGGHYRIPQTALGTMAGSDQLVDHDVDQPLHPTVYEYCWEYLAHGGEIKSECLDCITYRSRSKRCYELRDLPDGLGCLRVCETLCEECGYYRLVRGQDINIIIFGEKRKLLSNPDKIDSLTGYQLEFAEDEYDFSCTIEKFRPDFIVIDCSVGRNRTVRVCGHLYDDPRIPVTRIILASRSRNFKDYCDREVFGWITKPFTIQQLRNCVAGTRRAINQKP